LQVSGAVLTGTAVLGAVAVTERHKWAGVLSLLTVWVFLWI